MTADIKISDTELFQMIDKKLSETIDKEILEGLENYLNIVRKKSKALASSLNRCFENARKSMRYVLAYKLGEEEKNNDVEENNIEKYLEDHLKDYFEKNDFMPYREFVRLLRACTIEVGGDVSSEIKKRYNDFFFGERLVEAYKMGILTNR